MPLISVVIPVYNGEQTIKETIASVLAQTFTDLEVIVINDGSTDGTLDLVSSIADDSPAGTLRERIRVFSYPNGGQAASRNRGISHALGEFLAFIDADDLWTPQKLEAQLQALREHPDAAIAYSWSDCIDERGNYLRPASHITLNGDVLQPLFLVNFIDNGSNPLICKTALETVGGFDEMMPPSEDWDLWLRLAEHYPFVCVPQPHILYRQSTSSQSANLYRLETACLRCIDSACDRVPQKLRSLKKRSLANIYKYLTYKSLAGNVSRKTLRQSLCLLLKLLENEPSFLRRRVFWKTMIRIAIVLSSPPKQSHLRLSRLRKWVDIETLLVHIRYS